MNPPGVCSGFLADIRRFVSLLTLYFQERIMMSNPARANKFQVCCKNL
jgi:hypothetical protein